MDGPPPVPPATMRDTKAHHVAIGALAFGLLALGMYTLWNFLSALVWAGIFAIALWPFYRRVTARFGTGKHNVMWPMLFTLAVALVFIVPLGLIGTQLARGDAELRRPSCAMPATTASRSRTCCTTCRSARPRWTIGGSRTWPTRKGAKELVERTSNGRVGGDEPPRSGRRSRGA